MNRFGFPAVLADSVKNSSAWIHAESVTFHQMLLPRVIRDYDNLNQKA